MRAFPMCHSSGSTPRKAVLTGSGLLQGLFFKWDLGTSECAAGMLLVIEEALNQACTALGFVVTMLLLVARL